MLTIALAHERGQKKEHQILRTALLSRPRRACCRDSPVRRLSGIIKAARLESRAAFVVMIVAADYGATSLVEMPLNTLFSLVPRAPAPRMMATPIRVAMRPYSMAVAPDWSLAKRFIRDFMAILLGALG